MEDVARVRKDVGTALEFRFNGSYDPVTGESFHVITFWRYGAPVSSEAPTWAEACIAAVRAMTLAAPAGC